VSEASSRARGIFQEAAKRDLHLAVAELPVKFWEKNLGAMKRDRDTLTCLRSVLMKPEHLDWVNRIWELLSESSSAVLGTRT
jgi:tyrosine decarboxylase / aspartate 1-decarboxylase